MGADTTTTQALLDRLRRHYIRPGQAMPGGVFLPEVGMNGGWGAGRRCDAGTYPRVLDTSKSHSFVGGSERIQVMSRKNYPEPFRRDAVDLYESTPGATVRSVAAELGIDRATLRGWLDVYGTGRKTAADGTAAASPLKAREPADEAVHGEETLAQRVDRLEAENAALRREKTKLATERDILQKAAKYFAGETNW